MSDFVSILKSSSIADTRIIKRDAFVCCLNTGKDSKSFVSEGSKHEEFYETKKLVRNYGSSKSANFRNWLESSRKLLVKISKIYCDWFAKVHTGESVRR